MGGARQREHPGGGRWEPWGRWARWEPWGRWGRWGRWFRGGDGSGAWHQHPAHMSAQLQYLAAVVVLHAVGREAVAPPAARDGLVRTHALGMGAGKGLQEFAAHLQPGPGRRSGFGGQGLAGDDGI